MLWVIKIDIEITQLEENTLTSKLSKSEYNHLKQSNYQVVDTKGQHTPFHWHFSHCIPILVEVLVPFGHTMSLGMPIPQI